MREEGEPTAPVYWTDRNPITGEGLKISVTLGVTLRNCKQRNPVYFVATHVNAPLDLSHFKRYTYQQRTMLGDDEAITFVTFTR